MSRDDPKPGSDVPDRDTQDSGIPDPGIPDLGKMPELGQVLAMEAAEIEAGTAPVSGDCKDPEWFATLLDGYCTEAESREYQALLGEDAALAARFASYSKTVESFARLRAATEGEDGGPFLRSRILVALKEEAGLPAGRMAGPEQQAGERVEPGRIGPVLAFLGSVCVAAASLLLFFVLLRFILIILYILAKKKKKK